METLIKLQTESNLTVSNINQEFYDADYNTRQTQYREKELYIYLIICAK